MHRPIFISVACIGLILATYRLNLRPDPQAVTIDIIQTVLIFIWLIFGLRFSRLIVAAMTKP